MKSKIQTIKDKLTADVDIALAELEGNQLHFKARGKEYVYACAGDKERWAVPLGDQDGLKKLLSNVKAFEEQIKRTELDELIAKQFLPYAKRYSHCGRNDCGGILL